MNFKLFVGQTLSRLDAATRKTGFGIVKKYYPWGRDFVYDISRYFTQGISTIADVGANTGSVTIDFSAHFPEAQIYAFEPVSHTFALLKKSTAKFGNVTAVQLGLGARDFEIEIPLNRENTINSITAPPGEENTVGHEKIKIVSLDNFFTGLTQAIDIIKIDVEGYEFEVLEGASSILQDQVKAIIIEVGYQRGTDKAHFSDVEIFMESIDFQCCGIYDITKSKDKRRLYYSNSLYIRKNLI